MRKNDGKLFLVLAAVWAVSAIFFASNWMTKDYYPFPTIVVLIVPISAVLGLVVCSFVCMTWELVLHRGFWTLPILAVGLGAVAFSVASIGTEKIAEAFSLSGVAMVVVFWFFDPLESRNG